MALIQQWRKVGHGHLLGWNRSSPDREEIVSAYNVHPDEVSEVEDNSRRNTRNTMIHAAEKPDQDS